MSWESVRRWVYTRQRILAYSVSVAFTSVWTVLRFYTQPLIFDHVTQQVVVQQWLHGMMSPAHLGQTAYLWKMVSLYLPLELLPGSPRLKLILVTLLLNIVTVILLGMLIEKILRFYDIRISGYGHAGLIWLSTIAGSVFWIGFANSRNIEVGGGLLWVYLCLCYIRKPSGRLRIGMLVFGVLLFWADPLQLYMIAVPMLLYGLILSVRKKETIKTTVGLCILTLGAALGAKLLALGLGQWLQLSFKDTGSVTTPDISVSWIEQSTGGVMRSLLSLFAGANDAGRLRELANIVVCIMVVGAVVYTWRRRMVPSRLILLVASICSVDILVYIVSGQATQGAATSRYLIMVAPAAVLAFGAIRLHRQFRVAALTIFAAIVLLNGVLLGTQLYKSWDTSFPQDRHIESTYRYLQQHPETRAYMSLDAGLPLQYLHMLTADRVGTLACSDGALVRTYISNDAAFTVPRNRESRVTLILDGNAIHSLAAVCDPATIARQLGTPLSVGRLDDGSLVLSYPEAFTRLLGE